MDLGMDIRSVQVHLAVAYPGDTTITTEFLALFLETRWQRFGQFLNDL